MCSDVCEYVEVKKYLLSDNDYVELFNVRIIEV